MKKTLILTEKPSVARNIGDALGGIKKHEGYLENENYIITWAFGHLLSLYDVKDYDSSRGAWKMENFPFVPRVFEYKVKPSSKAKGKPDLGAKKQLGIIKKLMARLDVTRIVSACDYDREGQIIGDIIFKVLKPNQPVDRLLLNEWTQTAVLEGLNHLKSNDQMIPLRDAGISRQWADWVIGINLTAVATLKYSSGRKVLNVGRVLLPTLKIIYDRDQQIKHFIPEKYYKLGALFIKDNDVFEGIYYKGKKDKFKTRQALETILEDLDYPKSSKKLRGIVKEKQVKEKKNYPPQLYNLSGLQGHVTGKYNGWTAQKVLSVAQKLYEKKLITYPRTASVALEESLVDKARQVLDIHKKGLPFEEQLSFKVTKRIFDNQKVESHSAIMPTYMVPKQLTQDEMTVYYAIKNRFLMQFMPAEILEETKLHLMIGAYDFHASGKVQIEQGWKQVEHQKTNERILPQVEVGEVLPIRALNISSHETKPPKSHTEKSLLKVMETCGRQYKNEQDDQMIERVLSGFSIGTAATRGEIISKLKRIGYIIQEQKELHATELGCQMVESFPIHELLDLEYTGRLEKRLSDIAKGQLTRSMFLKEIFQFTADSVAVIKSHAQTQFSQEHNEQETLGICPSCGGFVVEHQKSFGCDKWQKGCKYVIWKNDKFLKSMKKKPTKTMVKRLLKDGRVLVKGLVGKSGNKFDAYLRYEVKDEGPYYQWKMEFK